MPHANVGDHDRLAGTKLNHVKSAQEAVLLMAGNGCRWSARRYGVKTGFVSDAGGKYALLLAADGLTVRELQARPPWTTGR